MGLKGGLYDAGEAAFGMEGAACYSGAQASALRSRQFGCRLPLRRLNRRRRSGRLPPGHPPFNTGPPTQIWPSAATIFLWETTTALTPTTSTTRPKVKLRASLILPWRSGQTSPSMATCSSCRPKRSTGASTAALRESPCQPAMSAPMPPPPAPPKPGVEPERPSRPLPPASPDRFRGVRIFDISDLSNRSRSAAVQKLPRLSHAHARDATPKTRTETFISICSGTGNVRQAEELAGCSKVGTNPRSIPARPYSGSISSRCRAGAPGAGEIVSSPRIFTDAQTGAVNGLAKRGNHGEGTQTTAATDKCHDITVYSAIGLAAGACSGNGILLDIHDPVKPVRLDAVSDPNYAFCADFRQLQQRRHQSTVHG